MKPEVRFKGFEDDWFNSFMKDVASFSKGKGYSKDDLISKGDPIILYGQMYTNYRFVIDTVKTYAKHKPKSVISTGNEVIIPSSGETSEEISRAAAVLKPGVILGGDLNIIKPNNDISASYLAMALSTNTAKKQMSNRAQGKSVVHLYSEDIKEVQVFFPSIDEQKRISNLIKELDNSIELKNKELSKLKQFKQAMLQEMFPQEGERYPRLRFAGFTDAWEQRKLGDFGRATGGTSIESEFSEDGIYKVISIGSYSENSVYTDQGIRAIDSEKTRKRILNKGDLTMILNDKTASGNIIGRVLFIEKSGLYVYNQRTERIEVDAEKYDSIFIYQMLNAPKIREKIIKQSQGNTQIYVNWPKISHTEYMVPKIDEQRKIGEYFQQLDNLITLHQRKLEKLKQLKQAMLQKMFV